MNLQLKRKNESSLNNIYGVDLDSNAVEVTKLSLLLKCMEGETKDSLDTQRKLFHERILPSLESNIKSGNSLIDLDYYDSVLDFGEEQKIKPFSWQKAFPDVFKQGGFDAVIGNPPYGAELSKEVQTYCLKKFNIGNTDTAALFMVHSKNLLISNGYNGFIIPKAFTYASNWAKTRDLLLDDIKIIVDCSTVWKEVKLKMSIYNSVNNVKSDTFTSYIREDQQIIKIGTINKHLCKEFNFILNGVSDNEIALGVKIFNCKNRLNDFIINKRGGMFQKSVENRPPNELDYKVLGGKQIGRYKSALNIKGVVSRNDITLDDRVFLKENSLLFQRIVTHIQKPQPHLSIAGNLSSEFDLSNTIILDTINQLENVSEINSKVLLSIINSFLVSWYAYKFIFANAIRTMQFDNPTTSKIPFPEIDLDIKNVKQIHDEIVKLVDHHLQLNKNLHVETLPENLELINSRIDYTEDKINHLVYQLYELTPDEIEIIEASQQA